MINKIMVLAACATLSLGCGSKIKENTDKVYSRHLQKHIDIKIISTPAPGDKNDFNLILMNEGNNMHLLRAVDIMDSLNKKKLIKPILLIGINTTNNKDIFGVAGNIDYMKNGKSAEKYSDFIINELLPFIKKKAGARKFNSVTLAGYSTGGLSAFDIGWNNWQKFDKIGVFSGNFGLSDVDTANQAYSPEKNNLVLKMVNSSRKRPKLKYWFYAGGKDNNDPANKNAVAQNTHELIAAMEKRKFISPGDIFYPESPEGRNDFSSWANAFPSFLIWVAGK